MKNILLLLVLCFGISCKENAKSSESISMYQKAPTASADEAVVVDSVATAASEEVILQDKKNTGEPEDVITQKIIKNANLRFQSSNLQDSYKAIVAASKKYQGNIQSDTEGTYDYQMYRNLIIRIPSQNFDNFITDISKGVDYFDTKEISSQDVTEEYIDVASRIKTKKVLEERYLELLKKAGKVSEMLEIEQQLSAIREEIEAKEGRLKYLQNKVAYSTITLEIYKPVASQSGATVSYGTKIWNAIKDGFFSISNFFIGLIENWPIILILVGIYLFIRKKLKKNGWIIGKKQKKSEHDTNS